MVSVAVLIPEFLATLTMWITEENVVSYEDAGKHEISDHVLGRLPVELGSSNKFPCHVAATFAMMMMLGVRVFAIDRQFLDVNIDDVPRCDTDGVGEVM